MSRTGANWSRTDGSTTLAGGPIRVLVLPEPDPHFVSAPIGFFPPHKPAVRPQQAPPNPATPPAWCPIDGDYA